MAKIIIALIAVCYCAIGGVNAFIATNSNRVYRSSSCDLSILKAEGGMDFGEVQTFLQDGHPEFDQLVRNNEELWKKLSDSDSFTIFAPTSAAFEALGEKKRNQLKDPRNGELAEKIGMYHVIGEEITAEALFNAGGVITMGGEITIEKSLSGGIFGVGGTEDGVKVGGSKVTKSTQFDAGVIHEVDGLTAPFILWRYADQLRIPGSQ